MVTRRHAFAFGSVAVLICSVALFAQDKDKTQTRKLSDAEKKEIQTVIKIVDEQAVSGAAAPNDLGLTWLKEDLLKAQNNKQYLPFSVSIDPSKVTTGKVSLYWRVISKTPPPADPKKDDKKRPEFPYEDLNVITVPPGQSGAMRISRSFTVAPGSYDVVVMAKETADKTPKNAPPFKMAMVKQTVTVPDLWNGELNTSSVILAERVDPLPAPLTPQQQSERPYALGGMEVVPAVTTKFTKQSELLTFLLIYNAKTDAANKPDVAVEYNFYAKQSGGEKFFNKTSPQNLNAQTLPPEFDMAAGHQLQSGQAVPLASFPEGEYRLEIKVTDKLSSRTLTRDVSFSVSGS